MIKKQRTDYIWLSPYSTIPDLIEKLQEIVAEHGPDCSLDISGEDVEMSVSYLRDETEKETQQRLEHENNMLAARRRAYENLKKEFEK